MIKLPAAPWHQRQSLKDVIAALDGEHGTVRFVGGAVRDTLLRLPVQDIDLATILKPENVMARLKEAGIKVIPTGIDHGTVTAVTKNGPVEITTLRRDVSTDGRRATVAFSDNWKEDAARRDFTINALFADPGTLEVYDYFEGLADLEKRHIRFIGSAEHRIAEDHLRIMRYFRFLARFGQHAIDQQAFDACQKAAPQLSKLSRERVADELMKLLSPADPVYAVQEMVKADVFANIVAEIDAGAGEILATLILREEAHDIAPDPIRRLVGLLPKDADKADAIAKSLRMSNRTRKEIQHRVPAKAGTYLPSVQIDETAGDGPLPSQGHGDYKTATLAPTTIRALAYHTSMAAARDQALLFGADDDVAAMVTKLKGWQPPTLPLTGGDLIAMGLKPGPIVAESLKAIEAAWVAEQFPDRDRVRQLARDIIKGV